MWTGSGCILPISPLQDEQSVYNFGPLPPPTSRHRDDRKETGSLAFFSFLLNFASMEWEQRS